jgi:hypothetical protein
MGRAAVVIKQKISERFGSEDWSVGLVAAVIVGAVVVGSHGLISRQPASVAGGLALAGACLLVGVTRFPFRNTAISSKSGR